MTASPSNSLLSAARRSDSESPVVLAISPAAAATRVLTNSPIVLTFSEEVVRGAGNIIVRDDQNNIRYNQDISHDSISVYGTKMTIGAWNNYAYGTVYTVEIPAGAVRDLAGNPAPAYSSTFTTQFIDKGTEGNDLMNGTALRDTMEGLGGDDTLRGFDDTDRLDGGEGNDVLEGGDGADVLLDLAGNNNLQGGAGGDSLTSKSPGASLLSGAEGNDYFTAGRGDDTVLGGAGDDYIDIHTGILYGRVESVANTVVIDGGEGKDRILVSLANFRDSTVRVTGGPGQDTFVARNATGKGSYTISDFTAGHGGDLIELGSLFSAWAIENPFGAPGLFKVLQRGADTVIQFDQDGPAGAGQFLDLMTLAGLNASTLLPSNFVGEYRWNNVGTPLVIAGTAGNDRLPGDFGPDTIRGGAGNDTIFGHEGADYLDGEGAHDYLVGGSGNDVMLGGAGIDELYGGSGDDQLSGGDDADLLAGESGDDTLDGGAGNDKLEGHDGNDILSGGAGEDTLFDPVGDNTFSGGDGDDLLRSTGTGKNLLDGGAGYDRLEAGAGTDTLRGGAGNDILLADTRAPNGDPFVARAIVLEGGEGDDVVSVIAGNYQGRITIDASGGAGRDTFTANSMYENVYTIADFQAGAQGDMLSVESLFRWYPGELYTSPGNPFATGKLRLLQNGADAILQFGVNSPQTLVTLKNVDASKMVADNFVQGISPDGSLTGLTLVGHAWNNNMQGGYINDTISGLAGDDYIRGWDGDDLIDGGDGDDFLVGGVGNDVIIGGAGTDIAQFQSRRADYTITATADGMTVVASSEIRFRPDGTDTLNGIERLAFNGTERLAFDTDGVGGQVYRLYQAAFDRTPDPFGIGFWMAHADRGLSLKDVSASFVASPEFTSLYGQAPSNADLVGRLYQNILDRAPDPVGFAFWNDVLDRKLITVSELLAQFSESAENQAALNGVIGQGFAYSFYWLA